MTEEVKKAVIIGAAIVVAAIVHGLIVRNVGRYQLVRQNDANSIRIDTVTGEALFRDGNSWAPPGRDK